MPPQLPLAEIAPLLELQHEEISDLSIVSASLLSIYLMRGHSKDSTGRHSAESTFAKRNTPYFSTVYAPPTQQLNTAKNKTPRRIHPPGCF
jgi:hypothetical protein